MPDKKPNTISDHEWRRLQAAARKRNPSSSSLSDPQAAQARKAARQQRENAGNN